MLVGAHVSTESLSRVARDPSIVIRVKVASDERRGVLTRAIDGRVISSDPVLADCVSLMLEQPDRQQWLTIHADQPWLRAPFGFPIEFETDADFSRRNSRQQVAFKNNSGFDGFGQS